VWAWLCWLLCRVGAWGRRGAEGFSGCWGQVPSMVLAALFRWAGISRGMLGPVWGGALPFGAAQGGQGLCT